jgi:hypothetical protein
VTEVTIYSYKRPNIFDFRKNIYLGSILPLSVKVKHMGLLLSDRAPLLAQHLAYWLGLG